MGVQPGAHRVYMGTEVRRWSQGPGQDVGFPRDGASGHTAGTEGPKQTTELQVDAVRESRGPGGANHPFQSRRG